MKRVKYFLLLCMIVTAVACQSEPEVLRLATTTSTQDSGLLDVILPDFEEQYDVEVDVLGVGTGEALKLGESGDVDVVLVHARSKEDAFVDAGYGINRRDVMYNDFIILGPMADPAGIVGMTDAPAALAQVAQVQAPFISRGDNSGTHTRELILWELAGIDPAGDWYQAVGQGMGSSLTIADEQQAYILSDRGTYLKRLAEGIMLEIMVMVEGDELLFNPYGVIAVNPELHEGINAEMAQNFIEWLTSPETQAAIDAYQVNGRQLFYANADGEVAP